MFLCWHKRCSLGHTTRTKQHKELELRTCLSTNNRRWETTPTDCKKTSRMTEAHRGKVHHLIPSDFFVIIGPHGIAQKRFRWCCISNTVVLREWMFSFGRQAWQSHDLRRSSVYLLMFYPSSQQELTFTCHYTAWSSSFRTCGCGGLPREKLSSVEVETRSPYEM